MRLFLDTSVLLSATGSEVGASRFIVNEAKKHSWQLANSHYCRQETLRNLPKIGEEAVSYFSDTLRNRIQWVSDAWSSDNILLYSKAKDKPVLLGALATKSDYLLTLDRVDFEGRLGKQFYGMRIRTPGDWLFEMRDAGKLQ
ncbi:PIN domain-containing protein [Pelagicoccus mobilis]|uniref:PIN domain-containing protein n=1 Tax=Pelagicoccus mobilis TaxID=415221 RepID=A0A934S360_9BACT|nr:PIN domain-containing protein [Pelagicoccus mobilis]MBK1880244.1 PIN domain-containing protein [Pelagicoccus mobilis]